MSDHICPSCGCEEVSAIYYSCPAQADCKNCGTHYEFGDGIKVLSLFEGVKKRPYFYEEYKCEACGLYKFLLDVCETEEDRELICKCEEDSK